MATDSINWKPLLLSNALTLVVSFLGGAALHWYTTDRPNLVYDIAQSHFLVKGTTIVSVTFANEGGGACKDAVGSIAFPSLVEILSTDVRPSSNLLHCTVSTVQADGESIRRLAMPELNSGDIVVASFLLKQYKGDGVKVEFRAPGRIGVMKRQSSPGISWWGERWYLLFFLFALIAVNVRSIAQSFRSGSGDAQEVVGVVREGTESLRAELASKISVVSNSMDQKIKVHETRIDEQGADLARAFSLQCGAKNPDDCVVWGLVSVKGYISLGRTGMARKVLAYLNSIMGAAKKSDFLPEVIGQVQEKVAEINWKNFEIEKEGFDKHFKEVLARG